jgi:acetylornithine aminotransferase
VKWKTFFANSGAEAIEGAIKLARRYGAQYLNGRGTIISAKRSFHGRTIGALTATGQPSKQDIFSPLVPGFIHVELNDVKALEAALGQTTEAGGVAAVLLEPVQGESGIWPCTTEYLQAARALTREAGVLLILDEVQTGFFRTGTAFAFQAYGIVPEVVCMAKGIASGFPLGAFAACGPAADVLAPGDHGSTFGGSALAVAAANATLDVLMGADTAKHVQQVGGYLGKQIRALQQTLPQILEHRGIGLMQAIQLDQPIANQVVDAALEMAVTLPAKPGLVLNATGPDTLRFLPPLVCTEADVDYLIDNLKLLLADAKNA